MSASPDDIHAGGHSRTTFYKQFNLQAKITSVTHNLLLNNGLGHAASIACMETGAGLYASMSTADKKTQNLLAVSKAAVLDAIYDCKRLIIIGGGPNEKISTQEIALINQLGITSPLREVILLDTSDQLLMESMGAMKARSGKDIRIVGIRADFKDLSGDALDEILRAQGMAHRDKTRAAVLMTGFTFGHIEGVRNTDQFPGNLVDERMACIADMVGLGSHIIFDHMTAVENTMPYCTREESEFFSNIPALIQTHCQGLYNFRINGDHERRYFTPVVRHLPKAGLIAYELAVDYPQNPHTVIKGVERVYPIRLEDRLTLMFSMAAEAQNISGRPVQNTGLTHMATCEDGTSAVHIFKKTGIPSALYHPDIAPTR
jgi:hypothetical protein